MNQIFRREVLKLRLMKLTNDIKKSDCLLLNKQFNNVYKMIDEDYKTSQYSTPICSDIEQSFDILSNEKLEQVEELTKLF